MGEELEHISGSTFDRGSGYRDEYTIEGEYRICRLWERTKLLKETKYLLFDAAKKKLCGRTIINVYRGSGEQYDDKLYLILDDGTKISTEDQEYGGFQVEIDDVEVWRGC